jgi:hypothetical protein
VVRLLQSAALRLISDLIMPDGVSTSSIVICATSLTRSVENESANTSLFSLGFCISEQRRRTFLIWLGDRLLAFDLAFVMCAIPVILGVLHTLDLEVFE